MGPIQSLYDYRFHKKKYMPGTAYNPSPWALGNCFQPKGIVICSLVYFEQNGYLTISIRYVWGIEGVGEGAGASYPPIAFWLLYQELSISNEMSLHCSLYDHPLHKKLICFLCKRVCGGGVSCPPISSTLKKGTKTSDFRSNGLPLKFIRPPL